jgi:hypothetical protein
MFPLVDMMSAAVARRGPPVSVGNASMCAHVVLLCPLDPAPQEIPLEPDP